MRSKWQSGLPKSRLLKKECSKTTHPIAILRPKLAFIIHSERNRAQDAGGMSIVRCTCLLRRKGVLKVFNIRQASGSRAREGRARLPVTDGREQTEVNEGTEQRGQVWTEPTENLKERYRLNSEPAPRGSRVAGAPSAGGTLRCVLQTKFSSVWGGKGARFLDRASRVSSFAARRVARGSSYALRSLADPPRSLTD